MEKSEVFLQAPETEETVKVQEEEWDCWIEGGWNQF